MLFWIPHGQISTNGYVLKSSHEISYGLPFSVVCSLTKSRSIHFYARSRRLRDFNVYSFKPSKSGYSQGVQFSQCCPSMTNIYKSRPIFAVTLIVSEIMTFSFF